MPALNDGHDALRSSSPGNIPTRDAAQSLDSSNPGIIVKLELNFVDASAVNSVPSGGHTARGEDVVVHVAEASASGPVTYSAIARQFIWLGWLAFGGPSAHIALFQKVRASANWARRYRVNALSERKLPLFDMKVE